MNRLASHYAGDRANVSDSDSDSSSNSNLGSISEDGEDDRSMIGVKFSKKFVGDSGVRSSFTGEVISRDKVGGKWLYKILYNDGDEEELTRDEIVEQIDGVDHSVSESECDDSDDSEYKE